MLLLDFSNVLRIGNGGAISALGNSYVGVEFSTFEGNSAFNGGAIYNMGYTNVNNTHFYDNKAIIGVSLKILLGALVLLHFQPHGSISH